MVRSAGWGIGMVMGLLVEFVGGLRKGDIQLSRRMFLGLSIKRCCIVGGKRVQTVLSSYGDYTATHGIFDK